MRLDALKMKYVLVSGGEFLFCSPRLGAGLTWTRRCFVRGGQGLDITQTRENNITTGKIYQYVIERERRGNYLRKTVQIVPHVTDAIQDWIERVAKIPVDDTNETPNVCIIELGDTV